jgi:hypothetical protein
MGGREKEERSSKKKKAENEGRRGEAKGGTGRHREGGF